jgi:hypothetical protein
MEADIRRYVEDHAGASPITGYGPSAVTEVQVNGDMRLRELAIDKLDHRYDLAQTLRSIGMRSTWQA